jgi:hypothetical protein
VRRVSCVAAVAALLLSACAGDPDAAETVTFDLTSTVTVDLGELYAATHPAPGAPAETHDADDAPADYAPTEGAPERPSVEQWADASSRLLLRHWCDQLGGRLTVQASGATVRADCTATVEADMDGRLRSVRRAVPVPDRSLLSGLPPFDRGDDPALDELLAACTAGEEGDCRELFELAPEGSRYRERSGMQVADTAEDADPLEHPRRVADRTPIAVGLAVVSDGRLVEVTPAAEVLEENGTVRAFWRFEQLTEPTPVSLTVRVGSWWNLWRMLLGAVALASLGSLGYLYGIPQRIRATRPRPVRQTPQPETNAAGYEPVVPRPPSFADPDSYTSFPAEWADEADTDTVDVDPVGEWGADTEPEPPRRSDASGALPPLAPSSSPVDLPLDLPPSPPPAGWYPDPVDPSQTRWWDGTSWGPAKPR